MDNTETYRENPDLRDRNPAEEEAEIARDSHSEGEISDSDDDDRYDQIERNDASGRLNKTRDHVWRTLAEEGAASTLIDKLAVEVATGTDTARGVEGYNFRAKFDDPRPDVKLPELEEGEALQRLRKEDTGVRARLGKRRREPESNLEIDIELARIERSKILEKANPEQVSFTKELAERLNESNLVLLAHVVDLLGIEHCRRLLQMTQTIEESGGLMIKNGSRRRSPGGVFLQLVKEDKSLTKAQLRSLFQPHHGLIKRKNKKMRILRKAHKALDELERAFDS